VDAIMTDPHVDPEFRRALAMPYLLCGCRRDGEFLCHEHAVREPGDA
jgi:hypothetical protein